MKLKLTVMPDTKNSDNVLIADSDGLVWTLAHKDLFCNDQELRQRLVAGVEITVELTIAD